MPSLNGDGSQQHFYPPGPKPGFSISKLLAYRRGRLEFLQALAKQYGDICYLKLGPHHTYILSHPDLVKEVLVSKGQKFVKGTALQRAKRLFGEGLLTSEGEFYRRQRRLAQPAFHRTQVETYATYMTKYAERARESWRDDETIDMSDEMMDLTLAIVGKTIFDTDVAEKADEVGDAITNLLHATDTSSLRSVIRDIVRRVPGLKRLDKSQQKFDSAKGRLDAIIYRLIDERRKSGGNRGDLLSMLLTAQDSEGDGGSMTDLQLRDEAITIFLTGHETTAAAMVWTFYLLTQHPEVEAKLHAEIDAVLDGRLPTLADFANLTYTEMVLSESMRLYPPAWAIQRMAVEDCEIGGYKVAKGSQVVMSQYVIHRDDRYFADPERFDPERWTKEAKVSRPQYAYFPFGAGTRRCIGETFAWMEALLLLTTIAQKWRFELDPKQRVVLQPVMSLRSKYGMLMTVKSRYVDLQCDSWRSSRFDAAL